MLCGGPIPPLGSIVAAACFRHGGCYPAQRELGGLCLDLYASPLPYEAGGGTNSVPDMPGCSHQRNDSDTR